jgi:hypothetical protein
MPKTMDPFRLLLVSVAGWMNQQQQLIIDYLRKRPKLAALTSGCR